MGNVRVRFAPSPTGFFHIGSARTALFNWLYAKHTNGTFVLRIEDTDEARNTPEALQVLMDGMKWLGLNWDEGPIVGGPYGPYFQSQRSTLYQEYLQILLKNGKAYEQDGAYWLKISAQPQELNDLVRGNVSRTEEKDFVIFRSNGKPVFHFVNVVDDITMNITHVIRGEDHLSNTSKHLELFKAFGAPIPHYAHIPLILKSDGPGKMSKRDRGALIEEYQSKHFIPQAVANYLCLLGWSPKDNREIMPLDEIIKIFELTDINKNNAHFDENKMAFVNAEYLKHLPLDAFCNAAKPVLLQYGYEINDESYLNSVLSIAQEKVRSLDTLPSFLRYFFYDDYSYDEATQTKAFSKGEPAKRIQELLNFFETQQSFSETDLQSGLEQVAKNNNLKPNDYLLLTRFILSGQGVGPSFYSLLRVLGKQRILNRFQRFIKERNLVSI